MVSNFGWKFHIVVFIINFLLLITISAQSRTPGGNTYFAEFMYSIVSWTEHAISRPINYLFNLGKYFQNSGKQEDTISALDKQVAELRIKDQLYHTIKSENDTLRQLLRLAQTADYQFMAADVIGYDLNSEFFKTIRIDRGERDGIIKNYPVVSPEGIVGTVVRTGIYSSQVLIIIGSSSAIGISIPEINIQAVAHGDGGNLLKGEFIPISSATKENQQVVTSGLDGIFPGGLPVGRTTNQINLAGLYKEITIYPYVNFYNLKNLFILVPSKPAQR
jgi:rod shape-determining protein MreC